MTQHHAFPCIGFRLWLWGLGFEVQGLEFRVQILKMLTQENRERMAGKKKEGEERNQISGVPSLRSISLSKKLLHCILPVHSPHTHTHTHAGGRLEKKKNK
jgi:hypothetical protein